MAEASKQLSEATKAYAMSLRHAEDLGHQGRIGQTVMSLADVARRAQDAQRAEAWYRRALEAFERLGSQQAIQAQIQLGFLFFTQGRLNELRTLSDTLNERLSHLGDDSLTGQLEALKLGLAAKDQDWHAFDQSLSEVYRLRLERGLVSIETAELLEAVGQAARRANELDRSEKSFRAALRQWEPINRMTEIARIKTQISELMKLKEALRDGV